MTRISRGLILAGFPTQSLESTLYSKRSYALVCPMWTAASLSWGPSVFLALLLCNIHLSYAAPVNRVSREIACENGQLWVEDRLRFGEHFSLGDPALNVLFEASRSGRTNLLSEVRTLMEPDSLSIAHYDARLENGFVELHVRSKTVWNNRGTPATLRWVASLGGTKIKFQQTTVGRTGGEMMIYGEYGRFFLWFPDLGAAPPEIAAKAADFKRASDQLPEEMGDKETEIICLLRSDTLQTPLFHWWNISKSTEVPSTPLLLQMHRDHPLSNNDWMGLITNLRIGKAGYYDIRPMHAFQNDLSRHAKKPKPASGNAPKATSKP